jgi:hypothetical protein
MDLYLELGWRDFHGSMIFCAREILNVALPPDLIARTEDRVYVESTQSGEKYRGIGPDVRLSERSSASAVDAAREPAGATAVVARPVLIELESDPVTEHYLEIVESGGGRVVTAIEFLSPCNKRPGNGRDEYLRKRREFLDSRTNLVEIDLCRGGEWVEMLKPYREPSAIRTTYRVSIRRPDRPATAELYPITLRQGLPTIAVPLRPRDPAVSLPLRAMLDRVYRTGRYDATDYRVPCTPPLSEEDEVWANELLRRAGRR